MNYAPSGYSFCSVETPQVFREYLLPDKVEDYSPKDHRTQQRLNNLAEIHGTYVHRCPYERG